MKVTIGDLIAAWSAAEWEMGSIATRDQAEIDAAEAVREARAQAWDEGAAWSLACLRRNPYRKLSA